MLDQNLNDDVTAALSCKETHYATPKQLIPSPKSKNRRAVMAFMLEKGLLSKTPVRGKYAFTEKAWRLAYRHNLQPLPRVASLNGKTL